MKRSEFLKRLGLGIAAIPLAPQFIAATKDSFDGAKAKTLLDDEAGVFPRYVDPQPQEIIDIYHETGDLLYSHYEEPWIHDAKPWPLMMWDTILLPNDKTYVVTEVRYGSAVLTPYSSKDKDLIVHKGDEMIRIPTFKSEL